MGKKDKQCVICKHIHGAQHVNDRVFENPIYKDEGRYVRINLCYVHDLELFKLGQFRFMEKYYHITYDVIGSDEIGFLNLMKSIVEKKRNQMQG